MLTFKFLFGDIVVDKQGYIGVVVKIRNYNYKTGKATYGVYCRASGKVYWRKEENLERKGAVVW